MAQVQVREWLHTAELCLHGVSMLDMWPSPPQQQHNVWAVLTPWRGKNAHAFISALMHYNMFHLQVSCTWSAG